MPPRKRATPAPELKIERREIATLLADPANARMHNRRNIEAIQASLRQFGQRKPIVVDVNNVVVAGNGTLEAAAKEGWEWIEVVVFPGTPGEARAFGIADNRTAELAEWDDDVLAELLKNMDPQLSIATGFNESEIDDLLNVGGDFGPVPEHEQPRLDKASVKCPECGHEFVPTE